MKIGITIPDRYDDYITKIANVNQLSKTAVCGLIVENFLSFNKGINRFPIFQQQIKIIFQKEDKLEHDQYSVVESEPENWNDQILKELREDNQEPQEEEDPDGLPF